MEHPPPKPRLQGVLPVFQTPWLADESLDTACLQKEIDWLYSHGVDGIVMAMVSELLRMDGTERQQLADTVCAANRQRGAVIISVGAEASRLAERYARHAEAIGATAVMAIPPVATALADDQLFAYYQRIIESISIPVIIQDASGYVGRPMPIPLQASLLERYGEQRVLYKPEAHPIGPNLTALLQATDGRARVFEGTGGLALPDSHQRGIVGTMPGADLVRALVPLWQALESGHQKRAAAIHTPLAALISMQTSLDAFLAVEKHLLQRQGIFTNTLVRGPVGYHLSEQDRRRVDHLFDQLMEAVAQDG
jgi:dihydrodipicolinate synthase/N-acetylneuraminate lyase